MTIGLQGELLVLKLMRLGGQMQRRSCIEWGSKKSLN